MTSPVEITITGLIPASGRLVFASSTLVRDSESNAVMLPQEIEVDVTANVEFTVDIPSTDDPEFSPTGWTWEVRPHFPHWKTAFSVAIPYDSLDGEIWFSDLVEVPANGTGDLYALVGHTHAGGGGAIEISDVDGLTAALAAKQTLDSDLTTIAGLTPTTDNVIQSVASAWASRTPAQLKTTLALAKGDVGLGNVDNTSDATKNAATATLTNKTLTSPVINTPTGIVKGDVGLGNVDNTSDANKPISTATQTALDAKSDDDHTHEGGGGSTLVVKRARFTSGDVTPQNTASAWAALTGGPTITIPAAVGDYIEFNVIGMRELPAATMLEFCVLVGGSPARYSSTDTGTPSIEGDPQVYPEPGIFMGFASVFQFEAESGDISGGNITLGIATKSNGTGTLYMSTNYPLRLRAMNFGPVDVS
jgi:hypothetical protein